jgi:ribosome-binding factor A
MSQAALPSSFTAVTIIAMSSRRIQRVSELAKQEISTIIQEFNLTNCGFVTVTSAEISPDLKEGRVYISVIGTPDQRKHAVIELDRLHGRIQHELSRRIILKYTPRLKFVLDETESHAQHIEHLLDELDEPQQSS